MASPPVSQLVQQLTELIGLPIRTIDAPQSGYRNTSYPLRLTDGQTVNLILYKREPQIRFTIRAANLVSNHLAAQGFPTRRTLDSRIIAIRSGTTVRYGALYNYLPGQTIPWDGYTMDHIKLLGFAMGQMHRNLQAFPYTNRLLGAGTIHLSLSERIGAYMTQPGVIAAAQTKLGLSWAAMPFESLTTLWQQINKLPHHQPLHLDFVRGNILFGSAEPTSRFAIDRLAITGILDFEKTAWGHPAIDLARTLAFLLVDCNNKTEAQIKRYFLDSGYHKRGNGQQPSPELLEPLINFFLIHDFYKFLRHNPYEYLPQNYHFRRTRDLLLSRNLLIKMIE